MFVRVSREEVKAMLCRFVGVRNSLRAFLEDKTATNHLHSPYGRDSYGMHGLHYIYTIARKKNGRREQQQKKGGHYCR